MQIEDLAKSTKKLAEATAIQRHKKDASFQLYKVLVPCMELCERCENDPAELIRLEKLFKQQPKNGNRRFVEKNNELYIYILVCRYVFSESNRTNAIRYAQSLHEAKKLQLNSQTLEHHLKHNGGVASLYYKRPLSVRNTELKVLRLSKPVKFSRDDPFTLTLKWRDDNTFEVIEKS